MNTLSSTGGVTLLVLITFGAWLSTLVSIVHASPCPPNSIPITIEEVDSDVAFATTPVNRHYDYTAIVRDIAHEFNLPLQSGSSTKIDTLPDKYLYHDGRLINLEEGVDAVVFISSYTSSVCEPAGHTFVFASIDPVSGTVEDGKEVERRTDLFSRQGVGRTVRDILMEKIPDVLPQHIGSIAVTPLESSLDGPSPMSNAYDDDSVVLVGMGSTVYRITMKRETQAIMWGSGGRVSRLYVGPERYNFRSHIKGTYSIGDRSEEVRWAQRLLNKGYCRVADSGPGSPGNESDYFGEKTKAALACFQNKNGIWAGNLGDLTPHTYAPLFNRYWAAVPLKRGDPGT